MKPIVSIIMGSTSDLPVMEKACKFLDEMQVPFEVNALSAHRTPEAVEEFARNAKGRLLRNLRVMQRGVAFVSSLPQLVWRQHYLVLLLPQRPYLSLVSLSKVCLTVLMQCLASFRCPQESLWQR